MGKGDRFYLHTLSIGGTKADRMLEELQQRKSQYHSFMRTRASSLKALARSLASRYCESTAQNHDCDTSLLRRCCVRLVDS